MTDEEIFDLYGLIIGTLRLEDEYNRRESVRVKTSYARNHYDQWKTHPTMVKAAEIYERMHTEKMTTPNYPTVKALNIELNNVRHEAARLRRENTDLWSKLDNIQQQIPSGKR